MSFDKINLKYVLLSGNVKRLTPREVLLGILKDKTEKSALN